MRLSVNRNVHDETTFNVFEERPNHSMPVHIGWILTNGNIRFRASGYVKYDIDIDELNQIVAQVKSLLAGKTPAGNSI